MSNKKRKKKKKDKVIRIIAVSTLLAGTMATMIFMIKGVVDNQGLSSETFICGAIILILFFLAGNIISPLWAEWSKELKSKRAEHSVK